MFIFNLRPAVTLRPAGYQGRQLMTNHQQYKQAERIVAHLQLEPSKHLVRKLAKRARKRSNPTNDRWGSVAIDARFMGTEGIDWVQDAY